MFILPRCGIHLKAFTAIFVVIAIKEFHQGVSADQICHRSVSGRCPVETCCEQSVCNAENSTRRCCDAGGLGCSACPTCRNCQWTEWSEPIRVDPPKCADGLAPLRLVGERTRKHIPYPDGNIMSPGGLCPGDPNPDPNYNGGKPFETKKPYSHDCPG